MLTHINYATLADNILEYILTGIHQKRKTVLNMIRSWDDTVFPNATESIIGLKPTIDGTTDDKQHAMDSLFDDEIEVSDLDDLDGTGGGPSDTVDDPSHDSDGDGDSDESDDQNGK